LSLADDVADNGSDDFSRLFHGISSPTEAGGTQGEIVFKLVKLGIVKVYTFKQLLIFEGQKS